MPTPLWARYRVRRRMRQRHVSSNLHVLPASVIECVGRKCKLICKRRLLNEKRLDRRSARKVFTSEKGGQSEPEQAKPTIRRSFALFRLIFQTKRKFRRSTKSEMRFNANRVECLWRKAKWKQAGVLTCKLMQVTSGYGPVWMSEYELLGCLVEMIALWAPLL